MSTVKPQFNCYVERDVHEEISEYMELTGIPRGKLVEQMWRFYQMRDITLLKRKFRDMDSPTLRHILHAIESEIS